MNLTLPRFAGLLGIVLAVCLWPSVVGGRVFVPLDLLWQHPPHTPPGGADGIHNALIGDMLYGTFAWKTLLRDCVGKGDLPLWNPYAFCGHPLYATGQASTFYPFNLIFLVVPLPYAFVVFTWLHLWLGGVFQYLFCRRIGVDEFGAAAGGMVFALCGFLVLRLIWPMLLGSAIWLPLMLICIAWLAESRTGVQAARRTAAGAIVFALPLLSGFFEIAFYAYFTAGLFTLAQCWRMWGEHRSVPRCLGLCGQALAVVTLAVMLAGPQLLPFSEVTKRNTRVGEADYDKMIDRALRPEHLLPMIIPDFFGHPARHHTWDLRAHRIVPIETKQGGHAYAFGSKNYSENGYYLGLLPFALAVLSLRVRGHHRWFLWALLAIALALAFGTRLYAVFWHAVPGFQQVRTPFRWMYPATFAIASLAAIGAEYWRCRFRASCEIRVGPASSRVGPASSRVGPASSCVGPASSRSIRGALKQPLRRQQNRIVTVAILAGPIALLVALVVLLIRPELAHVSALWLMVRLPELTTGAAFRDAWDAAGFYWLNLLRLAVFSLAAALILAAPRLRAWRPRGAAVLGFGCLALMAADAGQANFTFMTHADPAWLDRVPPSIRYLQSDPGVFRIGRFGRRMVLHPNLATVYGLQDVLGYDSIILADYAGYLGAIERQRGLWWNQIVGFVDSSSLDSPLLGLLNIRYMLTHEDEQIDHPDWELVLDGGMRVYRSKAQRPRAFMVHRAEPAGSLDEAIARLVDEGMDTRSTAVIEGPPASLPPLPAGPVVNPGRVVIEDYGHTRVDLATSADDSGVVVLCDMMYPGWRVYVDDQAADIMKVNGIFRGVHVPPGRHRVSFRFEPESLRRGWWLMGAGLCVLAGMLVVPLVAGRRCGEAPAALRDQQAGTA